MAGKAVFLEVDPSIRDKNLLIAKKTEEEAEFSSFLKSTGIGQLPPIAIQPTPGFCVKSHDKNGKKIFINFCQTDKIPAPRDVSEAQLAAYLAADEITDFRVPMSIGSTRQERDNRGGDVDVCDIAVNAAFMRKCGEKPAFKEFLIAVAFEGYQTKFDVELQRERIVLRNKKAMGALQVHHIQQREIAQKMAEGKLPKLDEIGGYRPAEAEPASKMVQVVEDTVSTPRFRLFRKKHDVGHLYGEFYMPYVVSSEDITLDVGEDRIVLESTNGRYFLDTFHGFCIDRDATKSEYNIATKFLTVTMPIKV